MTAKVVKNAWMCKYADVQMVKLMEFLHGGNKCADVQMDKISSGFY